MSTQQWLEALTAKVIHGVLAQFADIHGVAMGKLVPLKPLREWDEYALHVSDWELQRYANRSKFHIAKRRFHFAK